MDIFQIFSESLISSLPIYFIVILVVFYLKSIISKYIEMKYSFRNDRYDYTSDEYRMDIERKISKLTEQIYESEDRFKSVNHLVLDGSNAKEKFINQLGVSSSESKEIENTAFVLTPFNPQYDKDYNLVKNFFIDAGYHCERGDDVKVSNNVLGHIINRMLSAEIVIANISGRNPNVFYELGIAHALGKDVIIISRSKKDITFDISGSQVVIYNDQAQLELGLNKWLISILKSKKNKKLTKPSN